MSIFKQIFLLPGREASLKRRHPWIFSGAVGKVIGDPQHERTRAFLSNYGN